MRVIAGTARGKNLQALPGEDITRPTINRVKEAMFSSVQFLVPGARVLDLFAGSGQLGIEALSRGAKSCLFVDHSAEALAIVRANCKTAGVDRQSDIRQGEAESFLANIRGPFDLVLLDPPFHHDTVAAVLPLGTLVVTGLSCWGAAKIHPLLGLALQMFWCAQALAARDLVRESMNVYRELQRGDLPAARKAVARIVGRDTQNLTAEGVTKAAVETVAENASDGVIAPLLYMLIGGAPLALTYKAINTMDSMLGYKNERYLYFGRCAAKLDDAANWLPSRLAALLWVCAAALTGSSAAGAWRIWRRDRCNHASPNSAQTESACAGALGVQLAGPAYYFGEYYDKPTIGDALRPVEPKDILRADRMMYAESLLALVLGIALRLLVLAM